MMMMMMMMMITGTEVLFRLSDSLVESWMFKIVKN